ncbi:MAG: phytoene desaturase [Spirochaetaceae bacterium]|nr:MAG: phytoene desaturase [Spirochaetaceae bacterium]
MNNSSAGVPRVVVVGAGLGGLSAAIRLAAAGYPVEVYEKQSGPGGKAFTEQIGAYRFDTGPSLFTMKHVFEELFASAGRRLEDYLTLKPLERICNYFWPDGSRLATWSDLHRMAGEFERTFREPREHLDRYLRHSRRIYDITAHLFLERSLHEWSTLGAPRFVRSLLQLHRIDLWRTMDEANGSFFRDGHLRQLFNRYATYNGSNPYRTPATLNIIPHVEYGLGAWAVENGIYAVSRALEQLAREQGVVFHYRSPVERVLTKGTAPGKRPVRGVLVGGEEVPAEVVVSNADVTATYRFLLRDEQAKAFRRHRRLEPSSSGIVFYWGVRRRFPELGLHNIFFSADYTREFREIFREGRSPTDPTIYLNITSKEGSPGDAPEGGENWFVLLNAPWDSGQDWNREALRVRTAVLQRLSRELGTEVEPLIEVESRMLPPDIEARTDSAGGSLYGISSNTRVAAFRRHPNRSRPYPGLYFVGGSAHPGGGMPLVVLGGRIVADLVRRYQPRSLQRGYSSRE